MSHQRLCWRFRAERGPTIAEPSGRGVQVAEPVVKSADAGSKRQSTSTLSSARPTPTRKPGSSEVLRAPILLRESATAMSAISTPSGAGRSPYHSEPSIEAANCTRPYRRIARKTPATTDDPLIRSVSGYWSVWRYKHSRQLLRALRRIQHGVDKSGPHRSFSATHVGATYSSLRAECAATLPEVWEKRCKSAGFRVGVGVEFRDTSRKVADLRPRLHAGSRFACKRGVFVRPPGGDLAQCRGHPKRSARHLLQLAERLVRYVR